MESEYDRWLVDQPEPRTPDEDDDTGRDDGSENWAEYRTKLPSVKLEDE